MFRTHAIVSGWTRPALAAFAIAAMAAPAAVAGPVQIVSQERRIAVSARSGPAEPRVDDSAEASDAGLFIADVVADASTDGLLARSTGSVNSAVGPDRLDFAGTLAYEVRDDRVAEDPENPGNVDLAGVRVEYAFDVTFTLDERHDFRFTTDTTGTTTGATPASEGDFRLSGEGNLFTSDSEGVLDPGTYRLSLQQFAQLDFSGTPSTFRNDFDFALHLSPSDSGPGGPGGPGEPNPIPLPPAAWSGLLILGAAALTRVRGKLFG